MDSNLRAIIWCINNNTIGKTIKQFRTFLRNRIRKRIIPPIDMEGWTILEEEVDAVYLPWTEIKLMYQVELSSYSHLIDYRDDFVLVCMTGLRFSDFSKLMKNDLRGDMLYKKQQQSDHWVVILKSFEAWEQALHLYKINIHLLITDEELFTLTFLFFLHSFYSCLNNIIKII